MDLARVRAEIDRMRVQIKRQQRDMGPHAHLPGRCGFDGVPLERQWRAVHIATMSKPRVTFAPKRIAEGDWQIEAHYGDSEVRLVTGFKSKTEIDEWLGGTRKIDWLRSQGYAK